MVIDVYSEFTQHGLKESFSGRLSAKRSLDVKTVQCNALFFS